MPLWRTAASSGSVSAPSIVATTCGSIVFLAWGRLDFPALARRSFWIATICLMTAWPSTSACVITASLTSLAAASTITIASSVPATSRLSWLLALRSAVAGLTTHAPSQ